MSGTIVYMSGTLPALSETFVSSEVLGLRRMGYGVRTVSVHPPETDLGSDELDAMARETVTLYQGGAASVVAGGVLAFVASPMRSARVLARAAADVAAESGLPFGRRVKVLYQALAAISLGRQLREWGVAHVHSHMAHVPTTIAMYASMHAGISFSFTGHAVDIFKEQTLLGRKLRRGAFVSCISEWHRGFYREIAENGDERMPVIRCGVPLAAPRDEPVLSGPVPRIFAVGRLVPKKGFDTLLRALAVLQERGIPFEFELIGDGPEMDALKGLTESLGLGDAVRLSGKAPNRVIRERMGAADLFVLPCRTSTDGDRDGIPVVLMEAMSAGVCTVSGDLPAIRELVKDGETGVIVPPDDAVLLAEKLAGLIREPGLARAVSSGGRSWIEEEFSDAVNLERLSGSIRQFTTVGAPPAESKPNEEGVARGGIAHG